MRITKTVGEYFLGRGSFKQLGSMVDPLRRGGGRTVFLLDHAFADGALSARLPDAQDDAVVFVDTTHEPTTTGVDAIVDTLRAGPEVSVVIGIGGGSVLDTAKAVSNLLGNEGKAADYQGWDLLPAPGVFKIGVPTISGTGAEASRTCVMMNHEKNLKLGMNSDYTVFDRLILDPDLSATVPREQYFFTGMDTYIHCIESLAGAYRHPMADACSREALRLCREVFLSDDMQSAENRERLMVASFLGGSAIGNSLVGLVHPLSAGLSMVFGTHHCQANCIVMNAMSDFYPEQTEEFRLMAARQNIAITPGVCKDTGGNVLQALFDATIIHDKPLANALGPGFMSILTQGRVSEIFQSM